MPKVDLKPAHAALSTLVGTLTSLKDKGLRDLSNVDKPGITSSAEGWLNHLAHTVKEIETWCDNDSPEEKFTIDVPPSHVEK